MANRTKTRRGYRDRKRAAKRVGVCVSTLAHSDIPYEVIGGKAWYRDADLDAYVASKRRDPGEWKRLAARRRAVQVPSVAL